MSNLYGVIETSTPEQLLAHPMGADAIAINMEPGNGIVKRGTLVYRKATGFWAAAAAANAVITNALAVLNETVDTDADENIAEVAAAYRAGTFVAGKVVLDADAALTDAIKVVLRAQNIVFNVDADAAEFNNSTAAEEEPGT